MRVRDLIELGGVRMVHRDTHVSELAGIFDREQISGAPLIDDQGEVVGIVTKSDIVHFEYVGGDPYEARAREIGRTRIRTVREDASAREAAQIMLAEHIHRLLVVDADGQPAGMLTTFDFVRRVASADSAGLTPAPAPALAPALSPRAPAGQGQGQGQGQGVTRQRWEGNPH
ncbi:MAG: CBS domain-containing protein [Planctomycetota bacterium]